MTTVIRTEKLSKTYSQAGKQHHVLVNLDLEIEAGRVTAIMGPSGAGKSTLMYALSGLDRPTLGSVNVAGEEISTWSHTRLAKFRRRHCGFVFQQINLLDELNVLDNVMVAGLLVSDRRSEVRARADDLFGRLGIDEATQRRFPATLSGGEAQRVAIVRAMINRPTVLFADEPTGQLNSLSSTAVLDVLTAVASLGQTVVIVTHDPGTALRAERILFLLDGRIAGVLELPAYVSDDADRRARLLSFLTRMGW